MQTYKRKKSFSIHHIDETVIQIGRQHLAALFCIGPVHKTILGIYISKERNMLIAEKFIRLLVEKYGKHTVYTDDETWYDETCIIKIETLSIFSNREKSN